MAAVQTVAEATGPCCSEGTLRVGLKSIWSETLQILSKTLLDGVLAKKLILRV